MTDIVYNKNGIPFDIDALATDVNGKMDRDCLNYSDTGASVMASMAMPSDTYEDLTLGASGSTFVAISDGYLVFQKTSTAAGQYINIHTSNIGSQSLATAAYQGLSTFLPCAKGDVITYTYNAAGTTNAFRFIYAQGTKHEAT